MRRVHRVSLAAVLSLSPAISPFSPDAPGGYEVVLQSWRLMTRRLSGGDAGKLRKRSCPLKGIRLG